MRQYKWLLILAVLVSSFAMAKGIKQNVVFPKGQSGTTIDGSIARGDQDTYVLRANAGQTMRVNVHAPENNAAVVIYQPNRKTLPNAGEGDDANAWEGKLPAKGEYKIVVGAIRGGTEYSLTIEIE
jgi:hypothetical protein